ncbi:hypothetical protein U1Q18_051587 [Sarracenia purpurea var. burkii]
MMMVRGLGAVVDHFLEGQEDAAQRTDQVVRWGGGGMAAVHTCIESDTDYFLLLLATERDEQDGNGRCCHYRAESIVSEIPPGVAPPERVFFRGATPDARGALRFFAAPRCCSQPHRGAHSARPCARPCRTAARGWPRWWRAALAPSSDRGSFSRGAVAGRAVGCCGLPPDAWLAMRAGRRRAVVVALLTDEQAQQQILLLQGCAVVAPCDPTATTQSLPPPSRLTLPGSRSCSAASDGDRRCRSLLRLLLGDLRRAAAAAATGRGRGGEMNKQTNNFHSSSSPRAALAWWVPIGQRESTDVVERRRASAGSTGGTCHLSTPFFFLQERKLQQGPCHLTHNARPPSRRWPDSGGVYGPHHSQDGIRGCLQSGLQPFARRTMDKNFGSGAGSSLLSGGGGGPERLDALQRHQCRQHPDDLHDGPAQLAERLGRQRLDDVVPAQQPVGFEQQLAPVAAQDQQKDRVHSLRFDPKHREKKTKHAPLVHLLLLLESLLGVEQGKLGRIAEERGLEDLAGAVADDVAVVPGAALVERQLVGAQRVAEVGAHVGDGVQCGDGADADGPHGHAQAAEVARGVQRVLADLLVGADQRGDQRPGAKLVALRTELREAHKADAVAAEAAQHHGVADAEDAARVVHRRRGVQRQMPKVHLGHGVVLHLKVDVAHGGAAQRRARLAEDRRAHQVAHPDAQQQHREGHAHVLQNQLGGGVKQIGHGLRQLDGRVGATFGRGIQRRGAAPSHHVLDARRRRQTGDVLAGVDAAQHVGGLADGHCPRGVLQRGGHRAVLADAAGGVPRAQIGGVVAACRRRGGGSSSRGHAERALDGRHVGADLVDVAAVVRRLRVAGGLQTLAQLLDHGAGVRVARQRGDGLALDATCGGALAKAAQRAGQRRAQGQRLRARAHQGRGAQPERPPPAMAPICAAAASPSITASEIAGDPAADERGRVRRERRRGRQPAPAGRQQRPRGRRPSRGGWRWERPGAGRRRRGRDEVVKDDRLDVGAATEGVAGEQTLHEARDAAHQGGEVAGGGVLCGLQGGPAGGVDASRGVVAQHGVGGAGGWPPGGGGGVGAVAQLADVADGHQVVAVAARGLIGDAVAAEQVAAADQERVVELVLGGKVAGVVLLGGGDVAVAVKGVGDVVQRREQRDAVPAVLVVLVVADGDVALVARVVVAGGDVVLHQEVLADLDLALQQRGTPRLLLVGVAAGQVDALAGKTT